MAQLSAITWLTATLCLVAAGGGGCAGAKAPPGRAPALPDQPARATVSGDWDDVEAAIWTAAGRMEIAIEQIHISDGANTLTATLRTILGEPVTVTARRMPPDEGPRPRPGGGDSPGERSAAVRIQLEAQFGHFAEPDARAERLLELIERRLGQLQGVGAAPIR